MVPRVMHPMTDQKVLKPGVVHHKLWQRVLVPGVMHLMISVLKHYVLKS